MAYSKDYPPFGDHRLFFQKTRDLLSEIERKLPGIVGAREKEFLDLGSGLHGFHDQAAALASWAAELAELTSGQTMTEALDKLSKELSRMHGICEMGGSEDSLRQLSVVEGIVQELETIIAEFGRIVKKLSMLGMSTRIESARLGSKGRGFATLADDVEKLAMNIVAYSGQIVENAGALKGHLTSAVTRTSGIIDAQKTCRANIFENLNENIDSMVRMTRASSDLSETISEKTAAMAENISQAVLSMQFHDIVRQQVEHVERAVHDMRDILVEKASGFAGTEFGEEAREAAAWIGDVLQLQCSQLEHSRARFVEAVDSLLENLQGISRNILEIGEDIRALVGQETEKGETALAGVEKGITNVKTSLRDFAGEGEGLSRIMVSAAETIAAMSSFVEDIEEVGAEIELIAINASIKAAHTGQEGAALGVLASAIQGLSVEARGQTDAVSRILGRIDEASSALQDNAKRYYDNSQVDAIVAELESILDVVRRLDKESSSKFSGLRLKSEELGNAILALTGKVRFHQDVAHNLDAARQGLEGARAWAKALVPLETDHNRSERLRELYNRYTMEAERDVHEAAFGGGAVAKPSLESSRAAAKIGSGEDDFGDNVDLF